MRASTSAALTICALAAGVAVLGARQTPQQTPPVFRSGIEVVQLDVSVIDKRRAPVRGLTADNFTVLENGKPQRIVAVSEVTMDDSVKTRPVWARAAPPDVASNDVGDKRIFAIVIEGGGSVAPDVIRGVLDRLVPGDVVAVIGAGCYVPFTEDLEKLHTCLDAMRRGGPRPRAVVPPPSTRAAQEVPHHILRDVAEYLAAAPQRRKAILYIGSGFFMPMGGRASAAQERQRRDYQETLWFAHLANVNIYTFRPGFNIRMTSRGGTSTSYGGILESLAEETGGIMIDYSKLDAGLDQVFLENGSYYLVGYQTSNPQLDGKFRRLSVKVNRPDMTIRTRQGWYRTKPERTDGTAAAAVPSQTLTGRLRDWMPSLDVAFSAAVMPFAQPGSAAAAVAIVTGLAEPVTFGVTRVVQRMDVRVLTYNDTGALVLDTTRRVNLDVAASAESKVRYDVLQQVALPPGRYSFRIVAHNADTDKVGSIEFEVPVPDFARQAISLSGVAIASASAEPMASVGSLADVVPIVPTSIRKFLNSDRVTAFARVYQGGDDLPSEARIDVKILDAEGNEVHSTTETFAPERFNGLQGVDYRVELPLQKLTAGAYLLSLQATRGTRRTPPRDVRFIVR